jgi:hypothetical protein
VHRSEDRAGTPGIRNLQIKINVKHDDYTSMIKLQKETIALAIQFLESPHNGFKNAKIQRTLLKSIR